MIEKPRPLDMDATGQVTSAGGSAAVLTFAASVGKRTHVDLIHASYSAAPTGGRLSITDGGTLVFDIDIIAGGPMPPIVLPNALRGEINSAVVVTLAGGGGVIIGKLNVVTHLNG